MRNTKRRPISVGEMLKVEFKESPLNIGGVYLDLSASDIVSIVKDSSSCRDYIEERHHWLGNPSLDEIADVIKLMKK